MTVKVDAVARAICASMGYEPDGFDIYLLPENESADTAASPLRSNPNKGTNQDGRDDAN